LQSRKDISFRMTKFDSFSVSSPANREREQLSLFQKMSPQERRSAKHIAFQAALAAIG
jgi:hypothetical protein